MQTSSLPKLLPVPFADGGVKQNIPNASQIGITAGRASYTDGFPPLTRTPLAAGGVPPFGTDFNGVLNDITAAVRWEQAGGGYPYSSTFGAAISGYPKGAKIPNSNLDGFWLNTVENNQNNPEVTDASLTGWVPSDNYGSVTISGLSGSGLTLTSLQAAKARIILTGTLTSNINMTVPAWNKTWTIDNQCSGNFSVTVKTPTGSGVAITNGTKALVYGDGTNVYLDNQTANISTQVTGVVGEARNVRMNVASASATATLTADEVIVSTAIGGSQYRISNVNKTIDLTKTGLGGMNVGSAPTSGWVAIYLVFNPTTGDSGLVAINTTSSIAPNCFGIISQIPTYTASALVSVWGTTSSSLLRIGYQRNRKFITQRNDVLSTNSNPGGYTAISLAQAVPRNAVSCTGYVFCNSGSGSGYAAVSIAADTQDSGYFQAYSGLTGSIGTNIYFELLIQNPQVIYYTFSWTTSAVSNLTVGVSGYTI